jgi:hypothetical protein
MKTVLIENCHPGGRDLLLVAVSAYGRKAATGLLNCWEAAFAPKRTLSQHSLAVLEQVAIYDRSGKEELEELH